MSTPVWVEQVNGHFTASLLGRPEVRADGPTREAALAAVRALLADRRPAGELVWLDVPIDRGPALTAEEVEITRQMVADLYRERDEEKAREFPE